MPITHPLVEERRNAPRRILSISIQWTGRAAVWTLICRNAPRRILSISIQFANHIPRRIIERVVMRRGAFCLFQYTLEVFCTTGGK